VTVFTKMHGIGRGELCGYLCTGCSDLIYRNVKPRRRVVGIFIVNRECAKLRKFGKNRMPGLFAHRVLRLRYSSAHNGLQVFEKNTTLQRGIPPTCRR